MTDVTITLTLDAFSVRLLHTIVTHSLKAKSPDVRLAAERVRLDLGEALSNALTEIQTLGKELTDETSNS